MAWPTLVEFSERLRAASPEALPEACVAALYAHYRLLIRWNERVSLVGPGTLETAVETHYGEALAALPLLLPEAPITLVDVGSGAGFPGLVLAATRPSMRVTLVEARERKWSFLKAATLEAGIRADCVLGTVDRSVPAGFPGGMDRLTMRALKLPARAWHTLTSRLSQNGRVLLWAGREEPAIPAALRIRSSLALPDSIWKRILELERA